MTQRGPDTETEGCDEQQKHDGHDVLDRDGLLRKAGEVDADDDRDLQRRPRHNSNRDAELEPGPVGPPVSHLVALQRQNFQHHEVAQEPDAGDDAVESFRVENVSAAVRRISGED